MSFVKNLITGGPEVDKQAFVDPYLQRNQAMVAGAQQRLAGQQAPTAQAATIATAPQEQFRQGQVGLVGQLQQQAAGQGPSVAQAQYAQAADRGLKQQLALAASQGGNPALAARQAAMGAANINQDLAGQAAVARMQEQQAAQQALGQQLAVARQGDIGLATDQAQLAQQAALANQQARAQLQAQQNQLNAAYTGQSIGLNQGQFAANQAYEAAKQNQAAQQTQLAGNLLGAAGQVGAAFLSDKRVKRNIAPSGDEVKKFLDSLEPKKYDYKAGKGTPGKKLGILAQDMEKSGLGKSVVKETASGKMIDNADAVSALLASVADLNKRLKKKGI